MPSLLYSLFADDLVLFAKATPKNCEVVKEVLDMFCKALGQTISDAKSRVFFSPNIDQDSKAALSSTLGFQATNCLGKYIGFPIKHRGRSNQDFNFILDKVKKKLAGWKANLLSLAGRVVLITGFFFNHTSLCYAVQYAS